MKTVNLFFFLIFSFSLLSCAGYVNSLHNSFDAAEHKKQTNKKNDRFSMYRTKQNQNIQNSPIISSTNTKSISPGIKRQYLDTTKSKTRYTANDLNDNGPDGSLWASNNDNNFIFTSDFTKRTGDIITVNVLEDMKNEITIELKKNFPLPPTDSAKSKDDKSAAAENKDAGKKEDASAKTDETNLDNKKVYDKFSTVIIEEINRNHFLLRGKKYVLFRNKKRMIELQAMIPKRSIAEDNSINSDEIIESSIRVLR